MIRNRVLCGPFRINYLALKYFWSGNSVRRLPIDAEHDTRVLTSICSREADEATCWLCGTLTTDTQLMTTRVKLRATFTVCTVECNNLVAHEIVARLETRRNSVVHTSIRDGNEWR